MSKARGRKISLRFIIVRRGTVFYQQFTISMLYIYSHSFNTLGLLTWHLAQIFNLVASGRGVDMECG